MEITHNLGALRIKKNSNENAGFLLTNKNGSYCSFFSEPSSRYQGLFYFDAKTMNMFRLIENIELVNGNGIQGIKNNLYSVERKRGHIVESFLVPQHFNSLVYELSSESEIDLILDCKMSYDNREWGRNYEITLEDGIIIVKFTKKTDKREDSTDGKEEFSLYLTIKSSDNEFFKNDLWIKRNYGADAQRNSFPHERHVYNALRLKGNRFVFSISSKKKDAIMECEYIFENLEHIISEEKRNLEAFLSHHNFRKLLNNNKLTDGVKAAYLNAAYSLNNLGVHSQKNIFAGLPWFFQFWPRDSLISLGAYSRADKQFAEHVFFNYLGKIKEDGRMPHKIESNGQNSLDSADAVGWLFLRSNGLIAHIEQNKKIINSIKKSIFSLKQSKDSITLNDSVKKWKSIITKKEDYNYKIMLEIESALEAAIAGLLRCHTKDSFGINGPLETWMDSGYGDDGRKGARIEIQALRLNMYNLMFELTQNHKYKVLENVLRAKVREAFWNGKILADGLNDYTIRPNVFIAAYAYPELLSQKEWETCFENTLKALWLDWGGLSTIDKSNPFYTDSSTGENNKSYHRGDSWFWINNMAALALNRINKNKFNNKIKKILDASTEEILWKGCIGCHAELSDARELSSRGCWNQAWSCAMFMEMVEEIAD